MGATLLLVGIVAALASAPVFDRVLTRHLGITIRLLCPIIGAGWFALIWAGTFPPSLFPSHSLAFEESSDDCVTP